MESKQVKWVESIRVILALYLLVGHTIGYFKPSLLMRIWGENGILYGMSGKFAMSFFCIIAGYFAAKCAVKKNFMEYVGKRYISLVVPTMVANILCFLLLLHRRYNVLWQDVILESLILSKTTNINHIAWCMWGFLWGSIVAFGVTKLKTPLWAQVILYMAVTFGSDVWVGQVLLGSIGFQLIKAMEKSECDFKMNILKNKYFWFVCSIIGIILIRKPENDTTYIIDGICAFAILGFIYNSKYTKKILDSIPLYKMSAYSFEFFIMQYFVLEVLRTRAFMMHLANGTRGETLIIIFVSTVLMTLVSVLCNMLNTFIVKKINDTWGIVFYKHYKDNSRI